MTAHSFPTAPRQQAWVLPSRGPVAMFSLIIGESAIFTIFVVAYLFYMGKSVAGPTPQQVLEVPWLNTVCLLSSSFTIWRAEHAIAIGQIRRFTAWLGTTIAFGIIFLVGTAQEWQKLIY